ncbi:MAG: hypothetical protein ABSD70_15640 [Terracidiphilus sp.]
MACLTCTSLECALQSKHSEYITACSATIRRFSSRHVAYAIVEMERARSDLRVHREGCVSALAAAAMPASATH